MVTVSDVDAIAMTRRLPAPRAWLVGGRAGWLLTALSARRALPGKLVVVILPDSGRGYPHQDLQRPAGSTNTVWGTDGVRARHPRRSGAGLVTGAVVVPIYATSTYAQRGPGEHQGYEYSGPPTRPGPPWRRCSPRSRGCLPVRWRGGDGVGDGGDGASGPLLRPGDHVVLVNDAYGGTFRYFAQVLGEHGVEWSAVDLTDPATSRGRFDQTPVSSGWRPRPTRFSVGRRGRGVGSGGGRRGDGGRRQHLRHPYLQRPLDLGATLSGPFHHQVPRWTLRCGRRRRGHRRPRPDRAAPSSPTPPGRSPGLSTPGWCSAVSRRWRFGWIATGATPGRWRSSSPAMRRSARSATRDWSHTRSTIWPVVR